MLLSARIHFSVRKRHFPLKNHKDISALSFVPFLRTFLLRCVTSLQCLILFICLPQTIPLSNFPIVVNDRNIFFSYQDPHHSHVLLLLLCCPYVQALILYFLNSFYTCIFLCSLVKYNLLPKFVQSSKLFSQLSGSLFFWFMPHTAGKLFML